MDYEKKYKDALEKAKGTINYYKERNRDEAAIEDLQEIFPELKESEDEKIREALIKFHKSTIDIDGIKGEDIIAWLEKQKDYVSPQMVADSYLRGYNDAEKKSLEKQGSKPQGKSALEAINEQKPNNKPKFNVDNWICNSACIVHIASIKNGMYYFDEGDGLDITFVDNNYHLWSIADTKDGDVLYLQKDGKEHIIIYKGVIKERFRTFVSAYCAYNGIVDAFCFADVSRYADIAYGGITPATKEQRDLLFAKMKEAGYEWDDKEKKPIKSEASLPSFDEQQGSPIIDIPFGAKDSELQEAQYHIPEGFYVEIQGNKVIIKKGKNPSWGEGDSFMTRTLIDVVKSRASIRQELRNEFVNWLESLKNRVLPQPKEWSETDEKCIRLCTDIINSALRAGFCVQLDRDRCIDWLQSLKQRVIWKPSEIQLARLKEECDKYWEPDGLDTLYTLYQDLKKL